MVQGRVFLKGGESSSTAGHSLHQLTSPNIWCILQLMMTLFYIKMQVWISACVAKLTSGASCS